VGLTAFVGASVVALGTAAAFSGTSANSAGLTATNASSALTLSDLNDRQAAIDRANRGTDRTSTAATPDALNPGLWLLPLRHYTVAAPFGDHGATAHPGITLATVEGTPIAAAHAGTVVLARFAGGLGYTVVIDVGNGTQLVFGHAAQLMVKEGQHVEAGDVIGLVGTSGYTFGPQLYYEVQRNGAPVDTVSFMLTNGVDLAKATQSVDG
jgi:murein DD-endopeptidase MepM/ murein hydrolase activator NlpD